MANGNSNGAPAETRRTWTTIAVIFLVIFLAAGAYFELRPRRIRISVVKPMLQNVSNSIATNGKVEPIRLFEPRSPLAVTVRKILVSEGAQVKAGQLLLELDDTLARSQIATAETRLKTAQAAYSTLIAGGTSQELILRQAELHKATTARDGAQRQLSALENLQQRGAASPDEVAAARDRLATAQADLGQSQSQVRYSPSELSRVQAEITESKAAVELAQEDLHNCHVHAPFDGTVFFLPARLGAFVNVGDLLLQEADLSQLRVRAFVDEPEIGRLAIGQTVRIAWDALPGRTWQGTVSTLPSTVVSRGSRVVGEILCTVDNSERLLLPNINVGATIIANSKENALTVPREAVRDENGLKYVYVLQDNHLHRREVKLGISNLTRVEILSGISASDVIGVQSYGPLPMSDGVEAKIVENPS